MTDAATADSATKTYTTVTLHTQGMVHIPHVPELSDIIEHLHKLVNMVAQKGNVTISQHHLAQDIEVHTRNVVSMLTRLDTLHKKTIEQQQTQIEDLQTQKTSKGK